MHRALAHSLALQIILDSKRVTRVNIGIGDIRKAEWITMKMQIKLYNYFQGWLIKASIAGLINESAGRTGDNCEKNRLYSVSHTAENTSVGEQTKRSGEVAPCRPPEWVPGSSAQLSKTAAARSCMSPQHQLRAKHRPEASG